jgi:hypothetical protein
MAKPTTDESIFRKIEGLVHEEQHLYGKTELADHDHVRLEEIRVEAKVRPASVVERYKL